MSSNPTIERQQLAMERAGLDALIAYSLENVAYGAGYVVPSQALAVRDRQFALIVDKHGDVGMVLTSNELQEAEARSAVDRFYPYDEFADNPMAVLAKVVREFGLQTAIIGLEMDAIPADRWEDLKSRLPEVTWRHAKPVFDEARMIKTPAELERLRRLAQIAEQAQAEAHAKVQEGMTERDVYRLVVDGAFANGAETVSAQVAAGERSSYSNPTPGDTRLRRGDVVKVDVFVGEGGYRSDTGRAFVVGEASDQQRLVWARMQEALAAIHAAVEPGVTTRQVWDVFVDAFRRHDMAPIIKFLGHGLGLSFHEEPFIAAHTTTVLEPGMVLAVEPVYRVGDIGYHLEDNLTVTENGSENWTTRFDPDLIVVG